MWIYVNFFVFERVKIRYGGMMSINNKGRVENGVLRAHLKNFEELFQFSQFFHQSPSTYYYRGQADENWKLTTTLERFETELNKFVGGTRELLLKEFRRLIRGNGLLSQMDTSSEEEILALGQHYGLPTPLLDWTESFYIALFFAFSEAIPDEVNNVAIWAIQTSAKEVMANFNSLAADLSKLNENSVSLVEMKFVDPYTDINSRLVSQSGIFIQKPSNIDLEQVISSYCKGNNESPVLAKITVPAKERENILNNLFSMNINWATIYPGIEGAARHAKMKLQMLDLKVRKMGESRVLDHTKKKINSSTNQ